MYQYCIYFFILPLQKEMQFLTEVANLQSDHPVVSTATLFIASSKSQGLNHLHHLRE